MTTPPFKEYLFSYFVDWEKQQPGRRSSFSAFARWLSENSFNTIIKQQLVSDWIKGKYEPSDEKYIWVLAEKLGAEIYEILNAQRPNPFLLSISARWDRISPEHQQQLAEDAERYETKNEEQRLHETSKRRKIATRK